jgi:hypothetical protein
MRRATRSLAAIAVIAAAQGATAAIASAAPSNDGFGNARALHIGQELSGTVNGATKQRGEPRHAESLATRSVWYSFRATRKVTVLLGTCRSNFDSVISVYSGRRLGSLRELDFNNDGCGRTGAGSRVSFTARPGRSYRIAVVGFSPRGRFTLTVSKINAPPNDDFVDAARIRPGTSVSGTTRNATRELHEPRHASTEADLTVWFRLTVEAPRTIELNTCGVYDFDTVLAVYTGRAVDRLAEVTSDDDDCGLSSRVRFDARPGVTYRIAVGEYGGHRSGSFRLNAR